MQSNAAILLRPTSHFGALQNMSDVFHSFLAVKVSADRVREITPQSQPEDGWHDLYMLLASVGKSGEESPDHWALIGLGRHTEVMRQVVNFSIPCENGGFVLKALNRPTLPEDFSDLARYALSKATTIAAVKSAVLPYNFRVTVLCEAVSDGGSALQHLFVDLLRQHGEHQYRSKPDVISYRVDLADEVVLARCYAAVLMVGMKPLTLRSVVMTADQFILGCGGAQVSRLGE